MKHHIKILLFLALLTACSNSEQKKDDLTKTEIVKVDSNEIDILPDTMLTKVSSQVTDTTIYTDLSQALKSPNNVYRLHLPPHKNASQIDSFPMDIFKLKNLKELKLHSCRFTKLPSEIGQLKNLQHLDLSNNYLSELPSEIGNLENLETLLLNDNFELTSLPKEMGNLHNLKHLDFSLCWTNHFPLVICELESLEFLSAMKTGIDTVPSCIGNLKTLKTLIINNNPISKLPTEFGQLENLEELCQN
jgi:Leucine-rich repeat (LRR) protein